MLLKILLLVHVCGAVTGLLSGFMAMFLRKGSGWHAAAGTVFFVSMVCMTGGGAIIAGFLRPNSLNVVVSLLTFYLVVTARRAARQREAAVTPFDSGALLFVLFVALLGIASGMQAAASPGGMKDHVPAPLYFIFGAIALLCGISDMRMRLRGGVAGARRIARHLWRMSLALLITTLSFYPGQAKFFPQWLRDSNVLLIPHVLLFGAMLFHGVSMRRRKRQERRQTPEMAPAHGMA